MTNKVTRTTPGLIDSREVRSIDENNNYTYYPNVDYMYGPYESVEAAYNALAQETDNVGATALVKGKTVGVIEDGKIVEYWFESDPADATAGYQAVDLVKKINAQGDLATVAYSGSYNDLNDKPQQQTVIELTDYESNDHIDADVRNCKFTWNGFPVCGMKHLRSADPTFPYEELLIAAVAIPNADLETPSNSDCDYIFYTLTPDEDYTRAHVAVTSFEEPVSRQYLLDYYIYTK